jgi:chemotaxis protein MotB
VRFFWANADGDDANQSGWALPFADLMTLLLAVFVMIAAMSELRKGGRFSVIGNAVRGEFGFKVPDELASGLREAPPRASLIERLEKAGIKARPGTPAGAADSDLAACCDVVAEKDRVVIQLAGAVAFDRFDAALSSRGQQALARIAQFLADGQARLEIRGHAGDGRLPEGGSFRDPVDLSYARARTAANALIGSGVVAGRIYITACGDQEPLILGSQTDPVAANRRIEIIVHAATAAAHVPIIAEKAQAKHG